MTFQVLDPFLFDHCFSSNLYRWYLDCHHSHCIWCEWIYANHDADNSSMTTYNSNGHYQFSQRFPFISANGSTLHVSPYLFFYLHGISSSFKKSSNHSIFHSRWPMWWHIAITLSRTLVAFAYFARSTALEKQVIQSLSLSFTHWKVTKILYVTRGSHTISLLTNQCRLEKAIVCTKPTSDHCCIHSGCITQVRLDCKWYVEWWMWCVTRHLIWLVNRQFPYWWWLGRIWKRLATTCRFNFDGFHLLDLGFINDWALTGMYLVYPSILENPRQSQRILLPQDW